MTETVRTVISGQRMTIIPIVMAGITGAIMVAATAAGFSTMASCASCSWR